MCIGQLDKVWEYFETIVLPTAWGLKPLHVNYESLCETGNSLFLPCTFQFHSQALGNSILFKGTNDELLLDVYNMSFSFCTEFTVGDV